MPELAVVVPLRPMPPGHRWAAGSIPLHGTMLSTFGIDDGSVPELIEMVSTIASTTAVLETSGDHRRLREAAAALGAKSGPCPTSAPGLNSPPARPSARLGR